MNNHPMKVLKGDLLWHILLAVFVALFSLGITSAYFFQQYFKPSDGARLEPGASNWLAKGVRVEQLVPIRGD